MKKGLLTTLLAATASVSGIQSVYASAPTIQPLPDVTIGDAANNGATDNNYFVYTNAFSLDAKAYDTDGTPANQLLWSFIEGGSSTQQWYQINGKNPLYVGPNPTGADLAKAQRPDLELNSAPPSANNVVGGSKNLREQTAVQTTLGYNSSYATFRDIVFSPGWGPLVAPFPNLADPTNATPNTTHANGKPVTFFVSDGTNVSSRDILVKTVDNVANSLSQGNVYTKKRDDQFTTSSIWWGKMQAGNANATYDANTGSLRLFVATGSSHRILGWQESEYYTNLLFPTQFPEANELKYAEVGAANWIRAKFHVFAQAADGSSNVTNLKHIPAMRLRISGPIFSFSSMIDINPHNSGSTFDNDYAIDMSPTTSPANARVYRVDLDPPEYTWNSPTFGTLFNTYVQNPTQLGFNRIFEVFSRASEPQEQGYLCLAESSIGTYTAVPDNQFTLLHEWGTVSADWTTPGVVGNPVLGGGPGNHYAEAFIFELTGGAVGATPLAARAMNQAHPDFPGVTDLANDIVMQGQSDGYYMDTIAVDNRLDPDGMGKYAVAAINWYYGNKNSNDTTRVRIMPGTLYRAKFTAGATVASSVNAMIRLRVAGINNQFVSRMELGGSTAGSEFSYGLLPGVGSTYATGPGNSGVYNLVFASPMFINPTEMTKTTGPGFHLGMLPAQGQPDPSGAFAFWRELHPGADIVDEYISDTSKSSTRSKGQVKITNMKIESTTSNVGE